MSYGRFNNSKSNNEFGRPVERRDEGARRDRHDPAEHSFHRGPPPAEGQNFYHQRDRSHAESSRGVSPAENGRRGPGRYAPGPDRDNGEDNRNRGFNAPEGTIGKGRGLREQVDVYAGGNGGAGWDEGRDRKPNTGRRDDDGGPRGSLQDAGARREDFRSDDFRGKRELERGGDDRGRPSGSSRDFDREDERSEGRAGDRGADPGGFHRELRRDGSRSRDQRDHGAYVVGRNRAFEDGRGRREGGGGTTGGRSKDFGGDSSVADERQRERRRDDSRGRRGGENSDDRKRARRDVGGSYRSDGSRDHTRDLREQPRHERGYGHGYGGVKDDPGDSSRDRPGDGRRRFPERPRPSLGSAGRDFGDRRPGGSRDDRPRGPNRDSFERRDNRDSRDPPRHLAGTRRNIDRRERRGTNETSPRPSGSRLSEFSPPVGFLDGQWVGGGEARGGRGRGGADVAQKSGYGQHRDGQRAYPGTPAAPGTSVANAAGLPVSNSGSGRPRWDKAAPGAIAKEALAAIERKAFGQKPMGQQQQKRNNLLWGADKSAGKRPLWGGSARASEGSAASGTGNVTTSAGGVEDGTRGGSSGDDGVSQP